MLHTATLAIAALLSSVSSAPTRTQEPAASAELKVLRADGDDLVLEVADPHKAPSLFALMEDVGKIASIDFYLPERADEDALRKEQARLLQAKRIPRAKAYDFLQGLLWQHHFAIVEVGEPPIRTTRVVRLQGEGLHALKGSVRFVPAAELSLYRDRPATLITTTMTLEHIDVAKATRILARFFSSGALEGFGALDDKGPSNALMLVGFGPTLNAVRDMLKSMDVPPRGDPAAEELRFSIELWDVSDPALRRSAEELGEPKEIEARLLASSGAKRLAAYGVSLLTGKSAVVEGTAVHGRFEVLAQRHDEERYQLEVTLSSSPAETAAKDDKASSASKLPSTMLVRPGELRLLVSVPDTQRALFALMRIKR